MYEINWHIDVLGLGPAAKLKPLNKAGIVTGAIPTMKMQIKGE